MLLHFDRVHPPRRLWVRRRWGRLTLTVGTTVLLVVTMLLWLFLRTGPPVLAAPATSTPPRAVPAGQQGSVQTAVTHRHSAASAHDDSYGPRPRRQARFIAVVAAGQDAGDTATTEHQRQAALAQRNRQLCRVVKDGQLASWTGRLVSGHRDHHGMGVLDIEVADNVHVATWNNPFSDSADQTRIPAGRRLAEILALHRGELVTFSGTLVASDQCVNDSRLTAQSKLAKPVFIASFSSVRASLWSP